MELKKEQFGNDFVWGVSASAYQIEGSHLSDGKGLSIWDKFSEKRGNIFNNENANVACDFYKRYVEDIQLIKQLNIPNFRFSFAWSRIIPEGNAGVNQKGVDFYNRLIDQCLENKITPWATLYHWDLPYSLQLKGGWTKRDIVYYFSDFVELCAKNFSDRVKNWMVLNEPLVFTGAGYFLGVHAPGQRGAQNFIPAVHHAALCQAMGGNILKQYDHHLEVGTTFSCSYITPATNNERDIAAAMRMDALLNRLFIEPALGLGYPVNDLKFLDRLEKYFKPGDEKLLRHDFDFIGIQNYTREVAAYSFFTPYLQAKLIPANRRNVAYTDMKWEIYPDAIYEMIKKFSAYKNIKKLIITENGAAFPDQLINSRVEDKERTEFLKSYLASVLRAKQEGYRIDGYFIWTLLDNFEWAEGYYPRFGIVHVDFKTQKRTIKNSGFWYQEFLS